MYTLKTNIMYNITTRISRFDLPVTHRYVGSSGITTSDPCLATVHASPPSRVDRRELMTEIVYILNVSYTRSPKIAGSQLIFSQFSAARVSSVAGAPSHMGSSNKCLQYTLEFREQSECFEGSSSCRSRLYIYIGLQLPGTRAWEA